MGKKPFKSPFENQPKRSSFGSFVTVNSKSLSVKDKGTSISIKSDPLNVWSLPGYVWESKLSYDECCYYIILQAQASIVVVYVDEVKLPELAGTLRNLVSTVISVTLKTQRAQAAKALAAAQHNIGKGCVIILSPQMSVFAESCLPQNLQIKSIIHIGFTSPADFERRCVLDRNVTVIKKDDGKGIIDLKLKNNNKAAQIEHIHIMPLLSNLMKLNEKTKRFEYEKLWTSIVQRRVSAAKKLHFASIEGKALNGGKEDNDFSDFIEIKIQDSERDLKKGISGKIEALRNKLKILMSIPLPGTTIDNRDDKAKDKKLNESKVNGKNINSSSTDKPLLIDSSSTVREKMELLGMIALPAKGGEMHKLAEMGRSLAATRWIDSVPSSSPTNIALCGECLYPWGEVRYGASCDKESLKVRSVLNAFREYVSSKTGGKIPKRWEETDFVSKKLEKTLKGGRVVGFGWRPHIRGDDEWGGSYGKCCGHNEVVMFYCRPFMPLEVLNTHVCSKFSPAPGNEGYDGCLEFLQSQCRWFQRSMTVWDDKYFHFICPDAVDRPFLKSSLLTWSVPRIRIFMLNMRYFTVQCEGQIDPKYLLDSIDLLLSFACSDFSIDGLNCGVKVQRLICSYLLIGTTNAWSKANKSNR
jgi:hypothetical protein